MAYPLSKRINSLPVSQTLAMAAKARELKAAGKDIISLSLGEPDFNTPDFIKDAAVEAINQDYNSYTPVDGYGELKNTIFVFGVIDASNCSGVILKSESIVDGISTNVASHNIAMAE